MYRVSRIFVQRSFLLYDVCMYIFKYSFMTNMYVGTFLLNFILFFCMYKNLNLKLKLMLNWFLIKMVTCFSFVLFFCEVFHSKHIFLLVCFLFKRKVMLKYLMNKMSLNLRIKFSFFFH